VDHELIAALTRNAEAMERLTRGLQRKARAERQLAVGIMALAQAVERATGVEEEDAEDGKEGEGLTIQTLSGPVRVS
jgi:hypothetical protein